MVKCLDTLKARLFPKSPEPIAATVIPPDPMIEFSKRLLRVEGELEELKALLTTKVKTPTGIRTRLTPLGRHLLEKRKFLQN